jgi:hypothetical protein
MPKKLKIGKYRQTQQSTQGQKQALQIVPTMNSNEGVQVYVYYYVGGELVMMAMSMKVVTAQKTIVLPWIFFLQSPLLPPSRF